MSALSVVDLAGVVYSSGKVFNGLSTGRLDTDRFLRSGATEGIASRADLELLKDLRDAAQFIIDSTGPVDAGYVRAINATMTRSAALHPGHLRTAEQRIGVQTAFGPHVPPALTPAELEQIIASASGTGNPVEDAIGLFVALAKAQPFEDGNKRTALFAANGVLLGSGSGQLLVVPVEQAGRFNDQLGRAYIFGEDAGIADLLRREGVVAP